MDVFNLITLFGGLAMFLYGMRMMGDGLKESSGGALKRIIGKATDTLVKAFLLGLFMTALIQSSTATIVITSGLVGAGILSLHQSLGIIIGANVGTTVTGQIIRLLDLNTSGPSLLQLFKPSTLAPLALIAGVLFIMAKPFKSSEKAGQIVIGFGILFTGLMNMTAAVGNLTQTGVIESLFSRLGDNPLIGYLIGAGVAFVLQSASATIGILQAFSTSGQLTFSAIYAVLVGIYLGDCVTTAIVCNIGAKPDARRVGIVNILFNLSETILILAGVNLAHHLGLLDGLWHSVVHSGSIANTNTVFNLSCAILMMPVLGVYEKLSHRLIKDDSSPQKDALANLDVLNPIFLGTPVLALNSCRQVLLDMFELAEKNIGRAFDVVKRYDADCIARLRADEESLDRMADRVSNYLIMLSGRIETNQDVAILNHYISAVSEFECLGDHAMNMAECSEAVNQANRTFSDDAHHELDVVRGLIDTILDYTERAFEYCDIASAQHIEPLEEVVDDIIHALKQNHLNRLRAHTCSVTAGTEFLNLLSDIERISDICSNVGVFTIARARPELKHEVHDYVSRLHSGQDARFNREYQDAHTKYFGILNAE